MQNLMNQGLVQFSRSRVVEDIVVIKPITIVYRKNKIEAPHKRIQPIHIHVPGPFPYQDTKAVPWRYEMTAYVGGKEIQFPGVEIVKITGMGGMTRSGRVFAQKYTSMVSPSPTNFPRKEKVFPTPPLQAGAFIPATLIMTTVLAVTKVIPDKNA